MARRMTLLAAVGGISILVLGSAAHAATIVTCSSSTVSRGVGLGVWIGGPIVAGGCYPPVHREVIVTHPPRPRVVRPWTAHREVVVVRPPVVRHVVVEPAPRVVVASPPVVVEEGALTIWITNSNGSITSVRLTRHGSYYVGPRGEWYTTIPTNEQLRVVYGF